MGRGATPGDAPEAIPEVARPASIYVDDVAAVINDKCDCAECDSDAEAPPPYPRRRSARGAASGVRRADAAACPRPEWRLYRD